MWHAWDSGVFHGSPHGDHTNSGAPAADYAYRTSISCKVSVKRQIKPRSNISCGVRGELQPRSSHNVAALSEGSTRTPSSEDGLSIQSGPQDDEAPPAYEPPARRQSPDNKFFAASGVDAINEAVRQGAAQRLRKAPSTSQNAAGAEMDISDEVYKSLAEELKHKLGNKKDSPLLLPPKDYDTLHRQHGKTGAYAAATNPDLVGQRGSYAEEAVIETSNDSSTGNLRLNIYNKSQDYSHWTPKSRQTDNEAQNITRVCCWLMLQFTVCA